MSRVKFPGVADLLPELEAVLNDAKRADPDLGDFDVRLQVYPNGRWCIRWGDPSYDLDHHGFWGAKMLSTLEDNDLQEIARALIHDAEEHHFEMT